MSNKQHQLQPPQGDDAVVMWAEHCDEPDWDKLVTVVIAMALAEAEEGREGGRRD